MKRYLLFAFDAYYPAGGWADFKGAYDSVEDATQAYMQQGNSLARPDFYEIVDSHTGEVVKPAT